MGADQIDFDPFDFIEAEICMIFDKFDGPKLDNILEPTKHQ